MIESRLATIFLLNGNQIDFIITPNLVTFELVELVSSNLQLKEKEYFGLSFIDITGHRSWLQAEKRVLDHDFPKKNGVLILYFNVKFYIENIAFCKDKKAVELFYLQSKLSISKNELDVNNEIIFELAGLALQATIGDYKSDLDCVKYINSLQLLPERLTTNQKSFLFCEQKIISYYKKLAGMSRGLSIVNYLSIIEKLPNYGVHFYEVKDKSNTRWYLGISFRGIGLYEINNRMTCKKLFPWSQLENLYYRERKFSIEVHESLSNESLSSSNLNRAQQIGSAANEEVINPVKVYAWFTSVASLCKSIWLMAVAQHQFHLDKKQNKGNILQYKSLNDLALELCQSNLTTQTADADGQEKANINVDIPTNYMSDRSVLEHLYEKNIEHKQDLLILFKKRREVLQRRLAMKKSELEEINYKTDEIVAISKSLSKDLSGLSQLNRALVDFQNILAKRKLNFVNELEIEFNIQKEIMLTTLSLASDINVNAALLKKRRDLYEKEKKKFNKLNVKLQHERAAMELEQQQQQQQQQHNGSEDRNSMNMDQFRAELSSISGEKYSGKGPIMMMVGGSPVSIHRKNSYRLAQEQKLFLESNCNLVNKPNRNQIARRVKQLNNNMIIINSTTLNSSNSNASNVSSSNGSNNSNNNIQQQLIVNCDLDSSSNNNNVTMRHNSLHLNSSTGSNNGHHKQMMVNNGGRPSPNNFIPTDLLNNLPSESLLIDKLYINNIYDHKLYNNNRADASSSGYASTDLKYRSTSSNEMASLENNNVEGSSDTTTNSQDSGSSAKHFNSSNNGQTKYARIIPNNTNSNFNGGNNGHTNGHDPHLPNNNTNTNNSSVTVTTSSSSSSLTNPNCSSHMLNESNNDYKRYSTSLKDKNLFSNLDHSSNVNFMRRNNQRKNTSDSNVKLLADHNFYHINSNSKVPYESSIAEYNSGMSNRREDCLSTNSDMMYEEYERSRQHQYHQPPQHHQFIAVSNNGKPPMHPTALSSTSSSSSSSSTKSNQELSDLYKYGHNTFRTNTSTNSLTTLREKSNSVEDFHTNYGAAQFSNGSSSSSCKQQQQHYNYHTTENNTSSTIENDQSSNMNGYKQQQQRADYVSGNGSMTEKSKRNDLSLVANPNTSLNLSIHTAEEFGMEMLEWLNTNDARSTTVSGVQNGKAETFASTNLSANNATLV